MVKPCFFGLIVFLPTFIFSTSQSPSISVFMLAGTISPSFSTLRRYCIDVTISIPMLIIDVLSIGLMMYRVIAISIPMAICVFSLLSGLIFLLMPISIVAGTMYKAPIIIKFMKKSMNKGIVSSGK